MKIVLTSDPFIPLPPVTFGGGERIVHLLSKGLLKRGHDVTLVAHKDSETDAVFIPFGTDNSVIKNLPLFNSIKKLKPDIVHSFSRIAYLLPLLYSKTPKLMTYGRQPTISAIRKAVLMAKKSSLSFTSCSHFITDQIHPYAKCFTVYNGIDMKLFDCNERVPEDAPLVFLGRIEPYKGTDYAIKIAQLSGKKLIIAGNILPEHQAYFDKEIKPFLNSQIQYIGTVNDKQKNSLLQSALAFLMPNRGNEPFGIVMIEAMACGTPVIGFNRGGIPEVIKDGVSGYVVNDSEEAALMVDKVQLIDRGGVRRYCEENFSMDKIVDNYISIYESLLS